MFSSAWGVKPRARMWPANGKAICPDGSTTTCRSSLGSCSTEMLKLSPGLRVCAPATVTDIAKANIAIKKRILIPFVRKAESAPTADFGQIPPIPPIKPNVWIYKDLSRSKGASNRKNAVLLLICNDFSDQLLGNHVLASRETVHEGGITKNIDHTRDAAAGIADPGASITGEKRPRRTHRMQPERDIIGDVAITQRPQVKVRGNPLRKLVQLRGQQKVPELRLTDQNQLQNLMLIGIDV